MPYGGAWTTIAVLAAGFGLSPTQVTPAAPDRQTPPQDAPIVVTGPDADILVTGARPLVRGGLWEFRRVGQTGRPFRFTTCLPDGQLEVALRNLAGEGSMMPRTRHCGRLRMGVADGRVTGGRSCMQTFAAIGQEPQKSRLTLSGRYDARRLTIDFLSEDQFNGMERGGGPGWMPKRPTAQRWQAAATRLADCPAKRRLDQRTAEEAVFRLFDPVGNDD